MAMGPTCQPIFFLSPLFFFLHESTEPHLSAALAEGPRRLRTGRGLVPPPPWSRARDVAHRPGRKHAAPPSRARAAAALVVGAAARRAGRGR